MLKQLSRERHQRCRLEEEVQKLRSELAGAGAKLPQQLTSKLLKTHEAASRHVSGTTSNGMEVLQWKRLVKQSERRLTAEDFDDQGGKITQGLYNSEDAQHQYKMAARARQAAAREAYGSLQLGGGADV